MSISSLDGLEKLLIRHFCENTQLMFAFLKGPFLCLISSYYINDLLDDAKCNIVIYADNTTF